MNSGSIPRQRLVDDATCIIAVQQVRTNHTQKRFLVCAHYVWQQKRSGDSISQNRCLPDTIDLISIKAFAERQDESRQIRTILSGGLRIAAQRGAKRSRGAGQRQRAAGGVAVIVASRRVRHWKRPR